MRVKTLDTIKLFSYDFAEQQIWKEKEEVTMHGHGSFVIWHRQPTIWQIVGTRIALCIYLIVLCALPMIMIWFFSSFAGPIFHWGSIITAGAACVWYIVFAARGGLEVHDYTQAPEAT